MANRTFNIDLIFNTNTTQAENQIKSLQRSMENLGRQNTSRFTSSLDTGLQKNIQSANQLQGIFQRAIDPKTNLLNLDILNKELKVSGKNFSDFGDDFRALGAQGTQTFNQMARAITSAQLPIKKTNTLVDKLWVSLKNVATWQITSSALNAFVAAFQDAFSYAKNLNNSLNDIRIVTGLNQEKMAAFAKEANKAAKALSTTTNEYTKASLIYFQQGLNENEVKERTEVTMKLANVTGESAQIVSEWTTAIWNNFAKGGEALESYADKLAALGAATASSADEIATGLEKFSAVANTVGLSYDYATAALATVTAETRQSAEVVGTAFKTLFARMEGLKLGETLEDGTTLNQYSQALASVGVNIKDSNGNLRDMDNILEDLGKKWQNLEKDQQVALAQTVGGVRQYNQLIALMDNWDEFQKNLNVAQTAEGTLQKQQDIYAESWEAAADRVKASLEKVYDQLIDDEFFIDLTDGLSKFIDGISMAIDAMGGLKGMLPGLIALMTQLFGDKMINGAKNFKAAFNIHSSQNLKELTNLQLDSLNQQEVPAQTSFAALGQQQVQNLKLETRKQMLGLQNELPEDAKMAILQAKDELASYYGALEQEGAKIDKKFKDLGITIEGALDIDDVKTKLQNELNEIDGQISQLMVGLETSDDYDGTQAELKLLREKRAGIEELTTSIDKFDKAQDEAGKSTQEFGQKIKGLDTKSFGDSIVSAAQGVSSLIFAMQSLGSIWDTWDNEELSFWEKLVQTITSLSMAIPMVVIGLKAMKDAHLGNALATGLDTAATWLNTLANEANTKSNKENVVSESESTLSHLKSAFGKFFSALTKGFGALMKSLGMLILKAALVVGAILLVTKAVKQLFQAADEAMNKDKNALDEATKAADELKNKYEEMKQEYENFKETVNGYKDIKDGLQDLVKGTQEYTDSIMEANEKALELIKTNKELVGAYKVNENGMIEFDQGALDNATKNMAKKTAEMHAASLSADSAQLDAQSNYDTTMYTRTNVNGSSANEYTAEEKAQDLEYAGYGAAVGGVAVGLTGAAVGAKVLAGIGTLAGPVGTAIGAVVGAVLGGLIGWGVSKLVEVEQQSTTQEREAIEAISRNYAIKGDAALTPEEIKAALGDIGIKDEDLINSLTKDTEALKELVEKINQNNALIDVQNKAAADALLTDSELHNSESGRMALNSSGVVYDKLKEEAKDNIEYDISLAFENYGKEYAQQIGLTDKEGFGVKEVKDDEIIFKYLEKGEEKTYTATKEMVVALLASTEAEKGLEEALKGLQSTIQDLKRRGTNEDDALINFLTTGNFGGASKEELAAFKQAAGESDESIEAFLDERFGSGGDGKIANETAEKISGGRFKTTKELVDAIQEGYDLSYSDIPGLDSLYKNASIEAGKKLSINKGNLGEGSEAYLNILEEAENTIEALNLTEEQKRKAWDEIGNLDWRGDARAAYEMVEIVEKYGGAIDTTSESWQNNVNTLRVAGKVLNTEILKTITEIKNQVLEIDIGSIISEEEYNKIIAFNKNLAEFFTLTKDGYKMIGDKLDFKQEFEKSEQEEYKTGLDTATFALDEKRRKAQTDITIYENLNSGYETQMGLSNQAREKANEYQKEIDKYSEEVQELLAYTEIQTDKETGEKKLIMSSSGEQLLEESSFQTQTAYNKLTVEDVENLRAAQKSYGTYDRMANEWEYKANEVYSSADFEKLEQAKQSYENLYNEQLKSSEEYKSMKSNLYEYLSTFDTFEERAQAINSFNQQLSSSDIILQQMSAEVQATIEYEKINEEKWEGLDPAEVEEYSKYLINMAENSSLVSDELKNNAEAAEDVALYTIKMNKGIDKLSNSFADWKDILKNSDKASKEYCDAMKDMKDAMSDVLGVEEEFLTDDFIVENLENIEKAAIGDAQAIDELAKAAGQSILINISSNNETLQSELLSLHDTLINTLPDNLEVGATLKTDEFLKASQQMIDTANMSVAQVQAYYNSLGYEPVFETEEKQVTEQIPQYVTDTVTYVTGYKTVQRFSHMREGHPQYTESQEPITRTETTTTQTGTTPMTTKKQVPVLYSGADGVARPKVKEIRKKSSGSMNNYSSSNKGGKSPKGGGGSSSKPKLKTSKDKERYYTRTKREEDISREKEQAAAKADAYTGAQKIKYLKKQVDLSKQLRQEAELYYQEAKNYLEEDKKAIEAYGAKFDEFGNISNYAELMEREMAAYNAAVQSGNDEAKEAAEERWEKFTESMSQYEETANLVDEKDHARWEAKIEQINKELEAIDAEIEIELLFNDSQLETLNYLLELAGDYTDKAVDKAKLLGEQYQIAWDNAQMYSDTIWKRFNNGDVPTLGTQIKDLMGDEGALEELLRNNYGEITEETINKVIEDKNALLSEMRTMREIYDVMTGEIFTVFLSEVTTAFDRQNSILEHLNTSLESYKNIIDIIGKGRLGLTTETLQAINTARQDIANSTLEAAIKEEESLKQQRDALKIKLDNGEITEEAFNEVDEAYNTAVDSKLQALEEALQVSADNFASYVEHIAEAFGKSVSSIYGTIEDMQTAFNRQTEIGELYFQNYKKVYEISKLNRQINQDIEKTDNVKAQRELKAVAAELNAFNKDNKQMSQYDLEYLQKKYELIQAQIALEEAQNAKNQMTLQRDAEGNWGYVYTADQSQIDEANQTYEDKLFALQDYMVQSEQELTERYLQILADYETGIQELAEKYGRDSEEFIAGAERLQNHFLSLTGYTVDQIETLIGRNMDINNNYGTALNSSFGSSLLGNLYNDFNSFETLQNNTVNSMNNTMSEVLSRYQEYASNTSSILNKVGSSIEGFSKDARDAANVTIKASQEVEKELDRLSEKFDGEFQTLNEATKQWFEDVGRYVEELTGPEGELTKLATELDKILKLYKQIEEEETKKQGDQDTTSEQTPQEPEETPATPSEPTLAVGQTVTIKKGKHTFTNGTAMADWLETGSAQRHVLQINGDNVLIGWNGAVTGWVHKSVLEGFNTGGYTGEWGPEGRLAMLHQKEIVLNASDTENLLRTIDMVRSFNDRIESNARMVALGLSNIGGIASQPRGGDTLQQEVTIHAEFPNVTDHNEIELALGNLINDASQYVNRKD